METILVIRFKSIGDVLFTLPAVHALRENFPDAKITFFTSKENTPLLRGFREVNDVIAVDRAALRSGNPLRVFPEFFGLLCRMRAGKFDLVVDFQGYGETAWLSWWSGAPQRWGNVYGAGREWLYTRGVRRNNKIHPANWNLSLLQQCGLPAGEIQNEFVLPEDTLETAKKLFAEKNLDAAKPTLFIQPLTSSPHKNWPLENYLALARHYQSRGGQIIFGGGPSDRAALEPAHAAGFAVSAGVPLLVSAGLMKLSTLTVGGDTGLLHLAVAMGRRVVMLIHSITPGVTHPFQHPDWTVVPRQGNEVAKIPVADVLAAVERTLNEPAGNVSC